MSKLCSLRMLYLIKWPFSLHQPINKAICQKIGWKQKSEKKMKVRVDNQKSSIVPENHEEKYSQWNLHSLIRKWKISFILENTVGGKCPKWRRHFKAYQNARVELENTIMAKSCATPSFLVLKCEKVQNECIFLVTVDNF